MHLHVNLPHPRAARQRELARRAEDAAALAEGALRFDGAQSAIWDDADYLCAILALLTDGDRARDALLERRRQEAAIGREIA